MEDRWIEDILKKAKAVAPDLQPWPDYFDAKARELETISRFYRFNEAGKILEIGCGNGFTSALLSGGRRRVEAFDLPQKDSATHSIGIAVAQDLMRRLGIQNVNVTGGSVETLPFEERRFDAIFSEYVLHYVKDRIKALNEMRRVLKDDGVVITVVPNFTERILAPCIKHEYLLKRLLLRLGEGRSRPEASLSTKDTAISNAGKKLADYLLLRPDGAYKSFMEEFFSHTPSSWKRLFERSGFRVERTFSTQVIPLGLFDILGSASIRFLSKRIHRLNDTLGGLPVVRHMGYSLALVARKA